MGHDGTQKEDVHGMFLEGKPGLALVNRPVGVHLSNEYELDMGGKTQPSVNINDLLFTANYLLAVCDIVFPAF
jgi:hypothetical protein